MFPRKSRCGVSLLLVMTTGLLSAHGQTTKRRFTVADDIGLAHFGDPYSGLVSAITFSPDGQYFVVDTERGLLDRNRPESTLRVFWTEDVHQFLLHAGMTSQPRPVLTISKATYKDGPIITNIRWLSDSSALAFLLKTESGNDQLCVSDPKTKRTYTLTNADQHVTAFDIRDQRHFTYTILSPLIGRRAIAESRSTAVVGTGRSLSSLLFAKDSEYAAKLHDLSELWAVVNGRRFRVEDKSSGQPIPVYWAGRRTLALSPDGRTVVTALAVNTIPPEWGTRYPPSAQSSLFRIRPGAQDTKAFDGIWYVSEYVLIDLSTGQVKPLTNAPTGESAGWWWSADLSATWSSDGKSVALSNTFLPSRAGRSDVTSRPCVSVVNLVDGGMSCVEALKGQSTTEKSGYEPDFRRVTHIQFDRDNSGRVTVEYYKLDGSKASTTYVRTDNDSWTITGTINGWAAQTRSIVTEVKESLNEAPVLVALDETTKVSRVVLDPNPQIRELDLGEASVFKWQDARGRNWVGGLYKPPDYIQGNRYPLVVQTHGFVETQFTPSGVYPTAFAARELAAVGMLVLQVPDCPLIVNPEEGPCNAAGYEAGVQELVSSGLADPNRVGIIGFSRTCYAVLQTLTTTKLRFKAASITDGTNEGYLQYIVHADVGQLAQDANTTIGAPPFGEGLQQWLKRSPTFNMHKVTTPLQVVALGAPKLIYMWEPYAALRYLNKPVDLILLGEGTHILTNPAQRMVSQGGTVDWFRFWLKEEEDPDPAKVEQYERWRELKKLNELTEAKSKQADTERIR